MSYSRSLIGRIQEKFRVAFTDCSFSMLICDGPPLDVGLEALASYAAAGAFLRCSEAITLHFCGFLDFGRLWRAVSLKGSVIGIWDHLHLIEDIYFSKCAKVAKNAFFMQFFQNRNNTVLRYGAESGDTPESIGAILDVVGPLISEILRGGPIKNCIYELWGLISRERRQIKIWSFLHCDQDDLDCLLTEFHDDRKQIF